jgi:uncharacterized membrane protein YccC
VIVIVVMVLSLWVLPSWAERKTPAPVVDATGAGGSSVSLQGSSSSTSRGPEHQTLLDLMQRMDSLQNEVQQLLSGLEVQAHNLDELKK